MATYQQVLKKPAQGRRQLWYVCGSEPALVQDAYELACSHVHSAEVDVDKRVFLGGDVTARELEIELLRDLDVERQMVVLFEAEKFKGWAELGSVLKTSGVERFFVAVGSEEPTESVQQMFVNSTRTRYITCNPLSEEDQRLWIETRLSIKREAADFLVERARGDHDWILNQIRKLEAVPDDTVATMHIVKLLCLSKGVPDFAMSLLNQHKWEAMAAVERSIPGPEDVAKLRDFLSKYVMLQDGASHVGMTPRLLIERTGLTQKEISVFRKSTLYYDSQASMKCYAALLKLHEGLVRGLRQSYYALITRW